MTDHTIRNMLCESEALSEALDDVHVRFITIGPSGAWSFEKLGRFRSGSAPIEPDAIESVITAVSEGSEGPEGWSLRTFHGANGPTLLLERRPDSVVNRIPEEVLQTLKKRARRDGVVVIAGPPGSGKSNMLLWATRHLSDEQVILVSENAPEELPGSNVLHVEAPRTAAEHRDLQRLLRRAPNVSWDRLAGLDDVNTLLGGAGARRRTFTLDATDTLSTLRRVQAWRQMGYEAHLDVILQLTSSVIGRAEVLDLLVFDDGQWTEAFSSNGSRLNDVNALERQPKNHAITRPGIEPDGAIGESPVPEANTRPQTPADGQAAALRAGIRKRPGHPTQDFEGPMTIPVPDASEASEADDDTATGAGDDPITSRLDAESSAAVLEGFEEEDVTSSGEIDLQGFIAKRAGHAQGDSSGELLPEETRQYQVKVSGESEVRSEISDSPADQSHERNSEGSEVSEPDEIIPGVDLNAEETGTYNLENLKITRVEEIEKAEMDHLRALRQKNLEAGDVSNSPDVEFDDLPSVEIDASDLILQGSDDWDEDEAGTGHTAVANPDVYEAAAREVTERSAADSADVDGHDEHVEPDSQTNPSLSVHDLEPFAMPDEDSEDTAEFSLGDKIRIIRDRMKKDEG